MGYKTWWLPIYFVTLSKEEEDICQDLCLFLYTSTAEESSHVYVCQIFSGSSLALTAYSLASAPTKLKTCSCTSWHAFSHSSSPPPISPLSLPLSLFLTFFNLDQRHIGTKPDWAPRKDKHRILRHNYRYVGTFTHTCTLSLSYFKQPPAILWTGHSTDLIYCQNTKKPAIIYASKTAI